MIVASHTSWLFFPTMPRFREDEVAALALILAAGVEKSLGAREPVREAQPRLDRSIISPQRDSMRRVFQSTTEKAQVAMKRPTTA